MIGGTKRTERVVVAASAIVIFHNISQQFEQLDRILRCPSSSGQPTDDFTLSEGSYSSITGRNLNLFNSQLAFDWKVSQRVHQSAAIDSWKMEYYPRMIKDAREWKNQIKQDAVVEKEERQKKYETVKRSSWESSLKQVVECLPAAPDSHIHQINYSRIKKRCIYFFCFAPSFRLCFSRIFNIKNLNRFQLIIINLK